MTTPPVEDFTKMNDHDLLVTMHEQIRGIKADIAGLKNGTSEMLANHEHRLSALEKQNITTKVTVGIYLAVGAALAGLLIYHILGVKI